MSKVDPTLNLTPTPAERKARPDIWGPKQNTPAEEKPSPSGSTGYPDYEATDPVERTAESVAVVGGKPTATIEDQDTTGQAEEKGVGDDRARIIYSDGVDVPPATLVCVLAGVMRRRDKQDAEHGGPEHDDTHTPSEWVSYIRQFAGRAEYQSQFPNDLSRDRYEDNLFDVAALAVAAIQSSRRKRNV